MIDFVNFLLKKTYQPILFEKDCSIVIEAFEETRKDVNYHFKNISSQQLKNRIVNNDNELPIFLYRLSRKIYITDNKYKNVLPLLHCIMKDMCSCEIYYSASIGEGFYIVHGEGTVIGSRHKIGKGFKIYQGCIIGHTLKESKGCKIGNNVTVYSHSQILGNIMIGDNVIIGAKSLVLKNITSNHIFFSKYVGTEREII
jgi:serine O-acetyltransferase